MKNFLFVLVFLLISLFGMGSDKETSLYYSGKEQRNIFSNNSCIYQNRVRSFLVKAQAELENDLPFDENLLAEFQKLIENFDEIIEEESEEITALFFEVSEKVVLREVSEMVEIAAGYKKRKDADRLSGKLACAAVGSAVAGAVFFGAATVPYAEYVDAYETSAAVVARKKTVAVLIPAGILTAAAGGLLLSSAVILGTGERPEKNFALLKVTEERFKGSFLRRGGF